MCGPPEEVCQWSDPPEIQTGGHQEDGQGGRGGSCQQVSHQIMLLIVIILLPSRQEAGEVEDLQKDLLRRSAQLEQMQEVSS